MSSRLVFGLDLGLNNVGWAAVRKNDREVEILATGTFVFDSPLSSVNDPSEGLKSKIRGMQRRARRTLARRHQRKMNLYRLLADHGFLPSTISERTTLFCAQTNPYELRAKALTAPLTPYELGRVFCHLNQRRGFLSPRDLMLGGIIALDDEPEPEEENDTKDDETTQIKKEIQQTRAAMQGFETIGAYLAHRLKMGQPVRKKKLKNAKPAEQKEEDARRFVRHDRHMTRHEFELIWERQKPHHPLLTDQLKSQVSEILFRQRNLATNKATRGKCIFFKDQLRIPRASLTAQKFVIAQDVSNLTVRNQPGDDFRKLNPAERKQLVEHLLQNGDCTWAQAKQLLGLRPDALFNLEPDKAAKGKKAKSSGKKEKLKGSATVTTMKRILGEQWTKLSPQQQRELVGEIISIRDWVGQNQSAPAAIRRRNLFLRKYRDLFNERQATELATADLPEGYLNLSRKAIKKLMPHLLNDCVYSEACERAGLNHAQPEGEIPTLDRLPFPSDDQIRHAIVRTSVRSAIRVLNALRQEFGKPDFINIELPRDLAKSAKQREEDELRMRQQEAIRKEIIKELVQIGRRPTRDNIRKVQLWRELGGKALALEPDVIIADIKDLFEGGYDICHIVPRGHNLDNGLGNLFLGTEEFNRQLQGNRTPYEALGHTPEWERIRIHVNGLTSMPYPKRQRLLAKERPEDFTGRHLTATGWISREVLKLAQQMVAHKPNAVVVPGRTTSEFRKFWGLEDLIPLHPLEQAAVEEWQAFLAKAEAQQATEEDIKKAKAPVAKNRSNFLHHALDAIVVALTDRATLQAMATYEQLKDAKDPRWVDKARRKEERTKALPDPAIREKVAEALAKAVVVRRPNRKATGSLHLQMPEENVPLSIPLGEPWSTEIIGKHLVRRDDQGRAAQAYPLGNNHHVVIWERTEPNAKGEYERIAEVVPLIEAVRRREHGEPIFRKHHTEPGWRFVMAICKGDTVELQDGTIAVVSKFHAPSPNKAKIALWHPYVAQQIGAINEANPYLVKNLSVLSALHSRIVQNPLGQIVYREGGRE